MYSNQNGIQNTAVGDSALAPNTSGSSNTAIGISALYDCASGNNNTALGAFAGINVSSASSVICIGQGVAGADVSNTTWIGNIYGVTTTVKQQAVQIQKVSAQLELSKPATQKALE